MEKEKKKRLNQDNIDVDSVGRQQVQIQSFAQVASSETMVPPSMLRPQKCKSAELYMPSLFKDQSTERDDLKVNGGKLDGAEHFCYLGDILDCEMGVQRKVMVSGAHMVRLEESG